MEDSLNEPTFFDALSLFVREVDGDVRLLNEAMSKYSSSYSNGYQEGIKSFQTEIKKLQTYDDNIRNKLENLQEFGYFVESLQETVEQQNLEINKMEIYLQKFGFKTLEADLQSTEYKKYEEIISSSTQNQSGKGEKCTTISPVNKNAILLSPELSAAGKCILNGNEPNEVPVLKNFTEMPVYNATPTAKPPCAYYTPSSVSSKSRCYVQQWLEGIQQESGLTPGNQNNFIFSPMSCNKENLSPIDFDKQIASPTKRDGRRLIMRESFISDAKKNCTPEEPILSVLVQKEPNFTPEEPSFSSFSKSLFIKNPNSSDNFLTPEEPVLSNTINTCVADMPVSPVLTEITEKICFTHKTPSRETQMSQQKLLKDEDFLKTPELSDITLNIFRN